MKEIPMLFKTDMVKAILNGSKTQTRRIAKMQPPSKYRNPKALLDNENEWCFCDFLEDVILSDTITSVFNCPYGNIGDVIWVKETFYELNKVHYPDLPHKVLKDKVIYYSASFDRSTGALKKKPSLFMPKVASRIKLEIVSVRVERLNDISKYDAIAEGIEFVEYPKTEFYNYLTEDYELKNPIHSYKTLWEKINGKDSWSLNPFVWVIEFKKL